MAMVYGSSPVEHPALHILRVFRSERVERNSGRISWEKALSCAFSRKK